MITIDKPKYLLIRQVMSLGYSAKESKLQVNKYMAIVKSMLKE